jgi:hypothetical protein
VHWLCCRRCGSHLPAALSTNCSAPAHCRHAGINVGLLGLYATSKGNLALAFKLNCEYVLAASTHILIRGTVLGLPLDIRAPVEVKDGGLVSCAVNTLTTAIPFAGCLLAGLDPVVDLNLPLNVKLGPDGSGCTGLVPGLGGSLLAALGINLEVGSLAGPATPLPAGLC